MSSCRAAVCGDPQIDQRPVNKNRSFYTFFVSQKSHWLNIFTNRSFSLLRYVSDAIRLYSILASPRAERCAAGAALGTASRPWLHITTLPWSAPCKGTSGLTPSLAGGTRVKEGLYLWGQPAIIEVTRRLDGRVVGPFSVPEAAGGACELPEDDAERATCARAEDTTHKHSLKTPRIRQRGGRSACGVWSTACGRARVVERGRWAHT